MTLKAIRRSILGILLLVVGFILTGLALFLAYRILFVISENLVEAIGILGLFFVGGSICIEKGRNLVSERKLEISRTEEQLKAPIVKLGHNARLLLRSLGFVFLISFGIANLAMGVTALVASLFFEPTLFPIFAAFTCISTGLLALRAFRCRDKGKTKQVCICALLSIFLFLLFSYVILNYDL